MKTEIRDRPSFSNILVKLESGESITAESDAMASMSASLQIKTKLNGGFINAFLRRFFGGESLFINEFIATESSELVLTQPYPGDIECIDLSFV